MKNRFYIVIPSLDPDEKLQNTVDGLKAVGFDKFVLVDDGSRAENRAFFPQAEESLTVLRHESNLGKGAALKTAFKYVLRNCPDAEGVITVDGDGQHLPQDVLAVAKVLQNDSTIVLGCRDFSRKDIPRRSRFGNKTTSLIFKLLCGLKISDTQTGLRGLPASLLPELLNIKGNRFEYETNMLLKLGQLGATLKEIKIETVYLEENKSSHFHPIKDSFRIYRFILMYFFSSFISFIADISLFYILCRLLSSLLGVWTQGVATLGARICSSILNFNLNRKAVFDSRKSLKEALLRYYTLAVCQMALSAALVTLIAHLLGAAPLGSTVIKIIVDTLLLLLSFRIQRCWVFGESTHRNERKPKVKITPKKIFLRSLLTLFTAILMVVVTVVSACLVICYGPSKSLRNMLVISAKQASATKWVPELFLSAEAVDAIMEDSATISTDSTDLDDYLNDDSYEDEWTDSKEGMKLIFLSQPRFKAYLLLVRDPKRVTVGVSSEDFSTATEGLRMISDGKRQSIIDKYGALAAINAGEFADAGGTGTGAHPMGLTYSHGKNVWNDGARRTFIGFDKNDRLICREHMTKEEADRLGIRDAVCFQTGNVLIEQSGNKVNLHYGNNNSGVAQRTAIGQRADGTVILLVTDGRSSDSIGATRNDVISIMSQYGAVSAGMLDGGSSAMLYYRDYFDKYSINKDELDTFQKLGLVNRYKAFMYPRKMPTYFIVSEDCSND